MRFVPEPPLTGTTRAQMADELGRAEADYQAAELYHRRHRNLLSRAGLQVARARLEQATQLVDEELARR